MSVQVKWREYLYNFFWISFGLNSDYACDVKKSELIRGGDRDCDR
jgi:hypothetical protein